METKKQLIISKSKDDKTYFKQKGQLYYCYLPEDRYNEYMGIEKGELEDERIRDEIDTDILIRMVNKNTYQNRRKKQISKPTNTNSKEYKGSKSRRIKAIIATLIVSIGIGLGAYGYTNQQAENNELAKTVESLSDEELKDEIYNIIESEISEATGAKKEDIKISQHIIDAGTERTIVRAGENEYKHDMDLESIISPKGTLNSTTIRNLISQANSAKDRRELINVLRKAKDFSEKKDLEVDGENLKEVKEKGYEIDD